MRRYLSYIGVLLAILPFWTGCRDALDYDRDPASQLQFPSDTVCLDTVFSTLPSATYRLMLFNPHHRRLETDLYAGALLDAGYSVIADGMAVTSDEPLALTVEARDSLVLFVSLTAARQNEDRPVPLHAAAVFVTNGQPRDIVFTAFVQDVHLVCESRLVTAEWCGAKPYLLSGTLTVDDLDIGPGVSVYLTRGADLRVLHSLRSMGTPEEPVRISGNRLEKDYRSYPGQWGSLSLAGSGNDYILEHTEIRNGTNGLQVTAPEMPGGTTAAVKLVSCRILNMSYAGILNTSARLEADNTLVANCGFATLACTGGSCVLRHCTLAGNYSRYMVRHGKPVVSLRPGQAAPPAPEPRYAFYNTLIYGTWSEELDLGGDLLSAGDVLFDHCFIRTQLPVSDGRFRATLVSAASPFAAAAAENFAPDSLSVCLDAGDPAVAAVLPYDLAGYNRLADNAPDIGAYEYQGR
ncbi:MAG: hypothetical protein IJL64_06385 [Bacteroidales bacterium]|nr:hypothetical protein [Bacteroidales bacterium]